MNRRTNIRKGEEIDGSFAALYKRRLQMNGNHVWLSWCLSLHRHIIARNYAGRIKHRRHPPNHPPTLKKKQRNTEKKKKREKKKDRHLQIFHVYVLQCYFVKILSLSCQQAKIHKLIGFFATYPVMHQKPKRRRSLPLSQLIVLIQK